MYIPASFREPNLEAMHELMRAHPLGLLITSGASGLNASPLPFVTYSDEGDYGTLRMHMARANPHWKELQNLAECLVTFQGPQGYISASWYPGKYTHHEEVPTWDYATVHAWGKPRVIEEAGWLLRQLGDLTRSQEQRRAEPWSVSDAPPDYIAAQMKAIIGIEIIIERIEGKWKMSQNRDKIDREGVVIGLRDPDEPHRHPPLADIVEARSKALPPR